jgi:hypothetical protein
VKLGVSFWDEQDKVTVEENSTLIAPFSEEEIKNAMFSCYLEGALGPYGLPFLFFRSSRNLLRKT